ncbi:hypothetical protein BDZ89DRAFT_1044955 [Hymenopellis radicata]|nr:hypothetical protein BDZ89DRAFT_1044955 [Hymenopellis radicata]
MRRKAVTTVIEEHVRLSSRPSTPEIIKCLWEPLLIVISLSLSRILTSAFLDMPSLSSKYSTPHDYQHPDSLSMPGIATFIASAGIATALLVWLWTKRITEHPASEEHFFRNAIVAIERPGVGDNTGESFLYGLAIASIASTIVPICVPLLMGMVAYRIAAAWVEDRYEPDTRIQISSPTPQQYSLLLKVCGSSNLYAAYETGSYLMKSKRYPRTASTLNRAFSLLVIILLLSHSIGIADFWLHTTASSFVHTSFTPVLPAQGGNEFDASMPNTGSIINETACPGPSPFLLGTSSPSNNLTNCQSFSYASADDPNVHWGTSDTFHEAVVAGSNQSAVNNMHFVASPSGEAIAVIVPATMPDPSDTTNITFPTFGISSQCQPVTGCDVDLPESNSVVLCRSLSPALNVSGEGQSQSPLYNEDVLPFNAATNERFLTGYPADSAINPFSAVFVLNFHEASNIRKHNATPGWYLISRAPVSSTTSQYFIGSCQLSMYEVNVTETDGRYSLTGDPRLTDFNTTSALLAAYQTTLTPEMVTYLHSQLETSIDLPSEDFVQLLARNISASSIGYASPLMQRTESYSADTVLVQTASRYPLPALATFLTCLYLYGLLSLGFSLWVGTSRSSELGGTGVTELEVAQRFLTNSAAIVAQHFSDDEKSGTSTDFFNEKEKESAERLDIGSLSRGTIGLRRSRYRSEDDSSELSLLSSQLLP